MKEMFQLKTAFRIPTPDPAYLVAARIADDRFWLETFGHRLSDKTRTNKYNDGWGGYFSKEPGFADAVKAYVSSESHKELLADYPAHAIAAIGLRLDGQRI